MQEIIKKYESVLAKYRKTFAARISADDLRTRHEVLFSAHSCAIEGNSFTVGDTQELKEKGLGLIPHGKTLFEAFEILDHFKAYEFLMSDTTRPLSEELLKETHRILMANTLAYRVPDAVAGEYTNTDMCAGETVFGDHEVLIARVPSLMESTEKAILQATQHPMIIAARFHGFFEYLHPFRDGNGRIGRLVSNYILQRMGHPMIVIEAKDRTEYIGCLNAIRKERTDEYLIRFFFQTAIDRMQLEINEHKAATNNQKLRNFIF